MKGKKKMKRKNSLLVLIVTFGFIMSNFTACRNTKKSFRYDSGAYSSYIFTIPPKENYEIEIRNVLKDGENTCIPVVYTQYDEEGMILDKITDVYTVDNMGNRQYTIEFPGDQAPCMVLEDEYVFLGYSNKELEEQQNDPSKLQRTAVFLDKEQGNLVRTIVPEYQPEYITPVDNGFVIVGATKISHYSSDGTLDKTVTIDFPCLYDGFFEDHGKSYIIEEKEWGEYVYHEVNLQTGLCPVIFSSADIGINGTNVDGQYFFNADGEYKVCPYDMRVECLADWNAIDIRPPQKNLDIPTEYYRVDDERFAISYTYRDNTAEVLLFKYDSSIDYSRVETIKIGGYDVYRDPVLLWAIYTFNTSNDDYRVVLEDYSERFNGYLPEERRKATLNLTQYFKEGGTPDIFYGTRFDYSYMGRNGMVMDLSEYMNSDGQMLTSLSSAGQRLMIDGTGSCYQIFSGYIMYGYSVQEHVMEQLKDDSIFSLYEYSIEHEIPYSLTAPSDIVDEAIRYDFANLWGAYDGKKKISHEELEELVSIVLSLPVSQSSYSSEEDVVNGRTLMCPTIVYCDVSSNGSTKEVFQFIGYPSIHNSIYLAVPQCCLAISTTSKNKSKCWEVLSTIFSKEAQKQTLISGNIPVTQESVELYCNMIMYPEKVTDDVLKYYLDFRRIKQPATQDEIDRFLEVISKADTIATYDWGVFDILYEEINSYYSENRSPEQITSSIENRLAIYMQENYQ